MVKGLRRLIICSKVKEDSVGERAVNRGQIPSLSVPPRPSYQTTSLGESIPTLYGSLSYLSKSSAQLRISLPSRQEGPGALALKLGGELKNSGRQVLRQE